MKHESVNRVFLLLLENQAQYEAYLSMSGSLEKHDVLICCLSMAAMNYCQQNEVTFILPEDCYTDEESNYYRALSEQKIRDMVKHLNDYYHKKTGDRDGFRFDMGNYNFFMLYHFFGALHHRAFFLWKVIEKHNVERILIPQEPKSANSARPFPVSQYPNCYLDLCLNSVYRERVIPIPVESCVVHQYATIKTRIRTALGKFSRKFRLFNDYLNHVQNNIAINPWSFVFGRSSADILLLGSAYPWKHVFPDPRLKNRVSVFFETDEVDLQRNAVKDWFSEWFNWEDVFCGFKVSALGYYEMARIKTLSVRFIAYHKTTLNRLKNQKALIYAVAPYASQQYLLSVAKHLDIPRVCFQHGEMSLYYSGLWEESSEWQYVSHYFSYGDQVSAEKTNSAKRVAGFEKAISIGSPALDKLNNTVTTRDGHILYASSKLLNYGAGFVSRYCDKKVKDSQSLLIDYFEHYLDSNPDSVVIWKHNQERLTEQPIKKTSNVKIIREEKTFTDLLTGARIVILDRPSTTSIEAAMTSKPLFVLLANRDWYPLPEKLLRKRAVIAYSPEELRDTIDDYLKKGVYPADVGNREFVRAYGCHVDDGLSARRAADELLKVMAEKCPI